MILINSLYIDPSQISAIAALATGAIAVIGTSLLIWWRKTKKKVAKTLHIDVNANKEVEDDLVINEDEAEGVPHDAEVTASDKTE